jgi:hypothetical protein
LNLYRIIMRFLNAALPFMAALAIRANAVAIPDTIIINKFYSTESTTNNAKHVSFQDLGQPIITNYSPSPICYQVVGPGGIISTGYINPKTTVLLGPYRVGQGIAINISPDCNPPFLDFSYEVTDSTVTYGLHPSAENLPYTAELNPGVNEPSTRCQTVNYPPGADGACSDTVSLHLYVHGSATLENAKVSYSMAPDI